MFSLTLGCDWSLYRYPNGERFASTRRWRRLAGGRQVATTEVLFPLPFCIFSFYFVLRASLSGCISCYVMDSSFAHTQKLAISQVTGGSTHGRDWDDQPCPSSLPNHERAFPSPDQAEGHDLELESYRLRVAGTPLPDSSHLPGLAASPPRASLFAGPCRRRARSANLPHGRACSGATSTSILGWLVRPGTSARCVVREQWPFD